MKTTATLTYSGTSITVQGDYSKSLPARYERGSGICIDPPEPAEFCVEQVWISTDPHKQNIIDMLSESAIGWIEDRAIRQLEGEGT